MHKLKPELIKLSAKERLYGVEIPIIGLTGGIATGKSSVSKFLIENSYPLIDADSLVKDIYTQAKTIQFIKSLAPSVIVNSSIDFKALRVLFFENSIIKAEIEKFIYSKLPGIFADKLSKLDL
ncbi:MAG: dephospho-CoA kinase, partial [Halobacteriovoraceae bacterium]|nr:dephospho-CoA kinase [Halobacteriovoraceae bacterium]